MSEKRKNHSPDFKAKVALAAIKGEQRLSEIASYFAIVVLLTRYRIEPCSATGKLRVLTKIEISETTS